MPQGLQEHQVLLHHMFERVDYKNQTGEKMDNILNFLPNINDEKLLESLDDGNEEKLESCK